MKIDAVKIVYFSPTGTTKAIVNAIAKGIDHNRQELIDVTKPVARQQLLKTGKNDLLIVATPVYMGRLPAFISDWLHSIKSDNTPAAFVVMYGNRAYDNALLELRDTLTDCNCIPFAGAAYIGEHSFSSSELPSSAGRPDVNDICHAEAFGRKIYEKLRSISNTDEIFELIVPGNYPYGGVTNLWKVDFIAASDNCTQCGICVEGCPTGAINAENSKLIDIEKCTLCCACIKHCPQKAKTMKSGLMKDAAIRCTSFTKRKEPENFI
jgi:ferredoxin